jgi:hypothetical protein
MINAFFETGIYVQFVLFILTSILIISALKIYRECKYDILSLIALILFDICFLINTLANYFQNLGYNKDRTFSVIESFMIPLTLGITISILYIFIFEVERIRMLLIT